MRLKDKVAIVTGGASGIGKASARLFAKEGAQVSIADVSENKGQSIAEDINKGGGKAVFISCDVSDADQVKNLIERTVREFGKLDIVFNNAGIEGPLPAPDTAQVNNTDLDKILDVNLKGVFYGCKYAIGHLMPGGGGSIINTSSVAALVGFPPLSPYTASKGGIVALTKELAVELAPLNIRVNAIAPGFIETPMAGRFVKVAEDPEAFRKAMEAMHPLGRAGKPEEVAYAALYLASDESSFVTGHILIVDGGFTAR